MVEEQTDSRRTGPRNVDWVVVHALWTQGHSADWLAAKFNLMPATIANRCGWIDNHFPPGVPVRFKATLARRLDEAHSHLEAGQPVEAERWAKALLALVRAARAVEDWVMDENGSAAAKPAATGPEANGDAEDPRAELVRRFGRLLDFERKRRGLEAYQPEGPDPGTESAG